jgi:hypothetical protein
LDCLSLRHLCSLASSIIFPLSDFPVTYMLSFGHRPSSTGPNIDGDRPLLGSPVFRAKSFACMLYGSTTPQVRAATRDSAAYDIAFPIDPQGRHLDW